MFDRVLIANRGEVAVRIARTCRRLGIGAIGVHSDIDESSRHVAAMDESIEIGAAAPAESYLLGERIIAAALDTGAQAIHPGYGFLSESATFAEAVEEAGLVWVGPPPPVIEAMGDKLNARGIAQGAGVPVAQGTSSAVGDSESALLAAEALGYPLLAKASAGGGGIGMGVAWNPEELVMAVARARSSATRFFASPDVFLERYVPRARHVEVQVLSLNDGRCLTLGERDCSVQRRHQKLVEESPAPGLEAVMREELRDAAVRLAQSVGYRNAGTVEFLVDVDHDVFVFLEMNTRLQVEHPVTELVTGVDLVEQQFRIAAGLEPSCDVDVSVSGHAIEFRVCAEDPVRFIPRPGMISRWDEPRGFGIRVDAGYAVGDEVSRFYDPLLAKLCIWGSTREEALALASRAVADFRIEGPSVNLDLFRELLADPGFRAGNYDTRLVERLRNPDERTPRAATAGHPAQARSVDA